MSETCFICVNNCVCIHVCVCVMYAARHMAESPVGIIAGSAVAVVLCMLIVIIMVIIFLRRFVSPTLSARLSTFFCFNGWEAQECVRLTVHHWTHFRSFCRWSLVLLANRLTNWKSSFTTYGSKRQNTTKIVMELFKKPKKKYNGYAVSILV